MYKMYKKENKHLSCQGCIYIYTYRTMVHIWRNNKENVFIHIEWFTSRQNMKYNKRNEASNYFFNILCKDIVSFLNVKTPNTSKTIWQTKQYNTKTNSQIDSILSILESIHQFKWGWFIFEVNKQERTLNNIKRKNTIVNYNERQY